MTGVKMLEAVRCDCESRRLICVRRLRKTLEVEKGKNRREDMEYRAWYQRPEQASEFRNASKADDRN